MLFCVAVQSRNKVYSWKALRVLARENLPVFAQTVQRGGDLEVAARALYPAECPPAPAPAPTTSTPAPSGTLQQSGQAHAAGELQAVAFVGSAIVSVGAAGVSGDEPTCMSPHGKAVASQFIADLLYILCV